MFFLLKAFYFSIIKVSHYKNAITNISPQYVNVIYEYKIRILGF